MLYMHFCYSIKCLVFAHMCFWIFVFVFVHTFLMFDFYNVSMLTVQYGSNILTSSVSSHITQQILFVFREGAAATAAESIHLTHHDISRSI